MRITYLAYWIGISVMICVMGMKTVEFIYFSPGEDITLKCKCKVFYWYGPSLENEKDTSPVDETDIYGVIKIWNVSIYTKNYTLANTLPRNLLRRLKVIGVNLDLHITNVSLSDEGLYFCEVIKNCFVKPKRYILQQKLLPTKLEILQVIDNYTVEGIENSPLELTCLVESGKPPETLRWKKDGIIVSKGGPSTLVYSFVPERIDNLNSYTCEVQNQDMNTPITQTIHLDIAYKPDIKVYMSGNSIAEGEMMYLCCKSISNPIPSSISWYNNMNKGDELVTAKGESSLCYSKSNVSRHDTGNYTCATQNEIGNASSVTSVVILYPPVVNVVHMNLSDKIIDIQCIALGEPENFTFFMWEHRSILNEHIRYLNSTEDGTLQLLAINTSHRYQDTGFYTCNVSNGIPDYAGNMFQQGTGYLDSKGPPIFATDNKINQHSNMYSSIIIKVNVYSSSKIKCFNITEVDSSSDTFTDIKVQTNSILIKEIFHGALITVNGTEMIFHLQGLISGGSCKLNVTICNSFGQSSLIVDAKYLVSKEISQPSARPTVIIVSIVILTLTVLPLLLKCVFLLKDTTKNEIIEEETEVIEGQSESVDNRLYHSVQDSEVNVSQTPNDELTDNFPLSANTRMINHQYSEDGRLNYADVIFQPSSLTNEVRILGLEDRIHYADVDVSVRTAVLSDIDSVGDGSDICSQKSSSEDDFVYVGQIKNYMRNRTTNI